jgi:hypothetical protein
MKEPPQPGNPNPDPVWNEELEALYRIDLICTDTCDTCHRVTEGRVTPDPWFIGLGYDPSIHFELRAMLLEYFLHAPWNKHCASCARN